MSSRGPDFLSFLRDGIARGGFETDDALATLLPLMKQVLEAHERGLVAPLDGFLDLLVTDEGFLSVRAGKGGRPPEKNISRIDLLQAPISRVVDVVAQTRTDGRRRSCDAHGEPRSMSRTHGATIAKPVFLPDYRSWEHAIGHHDELTDIFSLGMLLASISCGLDFTDASDLEEFATSRSNLFGSILGCIRSLPRSSCR